MIPIATSIPAIGFGTYPLTGKKGADAILSALEVGYRHIDTAQTYGSEGPVGSAIERSDLDRETIFITTKITQTNFHRLIPSLKGSLRELRTDYVDMTLIHWPSPNNEVPLATYLGALAEARDEGLTRLIGVSNFTCQLMDQACDILGADAISTNQFECHLYLQNNTLVEHCESLNIPVTAYMPMAGGRLGDNPVINAIAEVHSATTEQIALAFQLHRKQIVIPKSVRRDRQITNLQASSITLSEQDIQQLKMLDAGQRIVNPNWGPDWD